MYSFASTETGSTIGKHIQKKSNLHIKLVKWNSNRDSDKSHYIGLHLQHMYHTHEMHSAMKNAS